MLHRWGFRAGVLLAVAGWLVPDGAKAGGFEFAGAGARAIGRAGAYAARSDDPMALLYNPANLAGTQGIQLHASSSLIFHSVCFDRDGTYTEEAYDDPLNPGTPQSRLSPSTGDVPSAYGTTNSFAGTPMPQVCQSHRVNVVPELAFSWRVNDRLGIGFGLVAPTAPGHVHYGQTIDGRQGVVRLPDGRVAPAPNRYGLIDMNAIIAYPTIGVGYQVHPRLRIGASFGAGIGIFDFTNISAPFLGEQFETDIYTHVKVHDWFIPRGTLSLQAQPVDGLDIMGSFTMQGNINATGSIDLVAQYYLPSPGTAPAMHGDVDNLVSLNGMKMTTGNPWQAALAIRYGSRIVAPGDEDPSRINDAMQTERWDVELDLGYEINSRVSGFNVTVPNDPQTGDRPEIAVLPQQGMTPGLAASIPPTLPPLLHKWKNQLTIRVGGDYNVVPGVFAVRGGVSFETMGQQNGYQQFDLQPWQRTGAHFGMTVRVGRTDISLAYAHFFVATQNVQPLSGCPADIAPDCAFRAETNSQWGVRQLVALPTSGATAINTGRWTTHTDILTAGLTYHFR